MNSITRSDRTSVNAARHNSSYKLWSISVLAVLVVGLYGAMFGNYRANVAIDTPWYLSISYNYCIKGINSDVTFGVSFPAGMGGTVAFGKLAALIQCTALAPFDWSLIAANALSVAGVVFGVVAIFFFLVGEGVDRFSAAIYCLALAVTEPFIAMANQSKYEYITFLFAAYSLLLARRHLFLSGLIAVLAIELQPIGIMAPIYLISYEASRIVQTRQIRPELNRIVKLGVGATLGLAVYFILHPNILTLLARSNAAEWNAYPGHFLYGYFFEAKLYRHLPELAAFLACLFVHVWKRDYRQWPFPIIATFATFFAGFLIRHANYFYTPFWYFPAFLVVFLTIRARWDAVWVPVLVLILFIPQYSVAFGEGHKYARQGELQMARAMIASRGADLSRAVIYGDSIFWPVFKDLPFQWSATLFNQHAIPRRTIYLICGLDSPFYSFEHRCADELPALGNVQQIDQFSWAGRKYLIYERRK